MFVGRRGLLAGFFMVMKAEPKTSAAPTGWPRPTCFGKRRKDANRVSAFLAVVTTMAVTAEYSSTSRNTSLSDGHAGVHTTRS